MVHPTPPQPRSSGVLVHPTALPGSPVCGTFGEPSRRWINLLADHNIGVWQLLPLAPPDTTGSPYSSPSCFALNPWFLDAEDLRSDGFIRQETFNTLPGADAPVGNVDQLDFDLAQQRSSALADALLEAWHQQDQSSRDAFETWCSTQDWLDDHARFSVLHAEHQGRTVDAFREPRIVLHFARGSELAADLLSCQHQRCKIRSRSINCRRPTRAAGPDDDYVLHEYSLVIVLKVPGRDSVLSRAL